MTLSENGEKGRRTASALSVLCVVAAIMSLLTFDVPLFLAGLWAAGGIKKGSTGARNVELILRIADIPLLIIIVALANSFTALPVNAVIAVIAVNAFLDVYILLTLLVDKNLNTYLREMSSDPQ